MNDLQVFIEMDLEPILAKVKDCDKVKCIEIMLGTIMEEGVIDAIRELVNHVGYDD